MDSSVYPINVLSCGPDVVQKSESNLREVSHTVETCSLAKNDSRAQLNGSAIVNEGSIKSKTVDPPTEKYQQVVTDCFREVGEAWKVEEIYTQIAAVNSRVVEKLTTAPCLYLVLGFRLASILAMLVAGIMLLAWGDGGSFAHGIMYSYIAVQVLALLVLAKSFYDACSVKYESQYTFIAFLVVMVAEIVVCPFVPFVANSDCMVLTIPIFSGFACINLIYELNLAAWIPLAIFLMMVGLAEFSVRAITCRLQCPVSEQVVLDCRYRLFPYLAEGGENARCVICLAPFAGQERVCRLQCDVSHIFHEKCIFGAIKRNPTCPICRRAVVFF